MAYFFAKGASSGTASFSDNFTRADANPMSDPVSGGTWTTGSTYQGVCRILSNQLAGNTGATTKVARVATPSFTANQRMTVTLANTGIYHGPMVRMQSSTDASGYTAYIDADNVTLKIYKFADDGTNSGAGTYTQLGANITITAVTSGVTLGIEVSGTTITAYRNGVSVGTRTDSTYSSGQPGYQLYGASGALSASLAEDV